jgi:hypothetical protein
VFGVEYDQGLCEEMYRYEMEPLLLPPTPPAQHGADEGTAGQGGEQAREVGGSGQMGPSVHTAGGQGGGGASWGGGGTGEEG